MEILTDYFQLPGYLTEATAMAAVALLGYLFGRHNARRTEKVANEDLIHDINRAVRIAKDLQQVTDQIRQELARHQSSIAKFQSQVGAIDSSQETEAWAALTSEAEALLEPTVTVTSSLSAAYDQLRKHSAELMNFAGTRIDPDTGVANRRALEKQLESQFVAYGVNKNHFCLAMFTVSGTSNQQLNEEERKDLISGFARLVDHTARDTDFVARYSEDEFCVVLTHTALAGATVFSQRLLRTVEVSLHCAISGGIAEVAADDDIDKIFSRVDSALYSARSNGGNCLYLHDGRALRRLPSANHAESEEVSHDEAAQEEAAPVNSGR